MASKLLDPDSTAFHVASALGSGGWALIDPNRPTRAGQIAYRVGSAAAVGASLWFGARDEDGKPFSEKVRAGLTVGGAGVALALMPPSERLDARWHGFLRRRGVRHPRWWTAAFTVATYAGAVALERWTDKHYEQAEQSGFEFEPLDEGLRTLVMAILEQTEEHGSLALRAQLAHARRVRHDGERDVAEWVSLDVDDAGPRAVPADAVFPVRARFATRRGALDLRIQVTDGLLDSVGWEVAQGPDDEWLEVTEILGDTTQWPSAEEVLMVEETSRGLEPVVR